MQRCVVVNGGGLEPLLFTYISRGSDCYDPSLADLCFKLFRVPNLLVHREGS